MAYPGEGSPQGARDSVEFVSLMRQLKERSGLTLRQLEERAQEHGAALPRSTLSDTLRHGLLPRPDLLAAFVRACGEGHLVQEWLAARDRIAAGVETRTEDGTEGDPEPGPGREGDSEREAGSGSGPEAGSGSEAGRARWSGGRFSGVTRGGEPAGAGDASGDYDGDLDRDGGGDPDVVGGFDGDRARTAWRRRLRTPGGLIATVVALLTVAAIGYVALPQTKEEGRAPAPGTYHLQSAASSLCLSERDGDESSTVYQVPCKDTFITYTVEQTDDGTYRIRSLHPAFGLGCLGIAGGSMKTGALVADDECGHRGTSESFRLTWITAPTPGYRLVPVHTGACVSVPGAPAREWTAVRQLPCDEDDPGQVWQFQAVPSPSAVPTGPDTT